MNSGKRALSVMVALAILLSLPAFAHAEMRSAELETGGEASAARVEETVWYFRVYNGVWQTRLWSNTYSKWLTDWMPA